MASVTFVKVSNEDLEKITSARLIVGLASNLGVRELVLKMLLKDVVNIKELIASL